MSLPFRTLSDVMAAEYRAGKARKDANDPKARAFHNAPHASALGRARPAPEAVPCRCCGETRWRPDKSADVCVGCELGGAA